MNYDELFPKDKNFGGYYDFEKASTYTTNEIKNWIWSAIECGFPVPGCLNLRCLRDVLISRGESPSGYHNT